MSDANGKEIRRDKETGLPIFLVEYNVKKFCHREITEQTEDGDVVDVKMRPTTQFLQKLNERIFDLLELSIQNAREDDRTNLMINDVPSLYDEDDEEELDDE